MSLAPGGASASLRTIRSSWRTRKRRLRIARRCCDRSSSACACTSRRISLDTSGSGWSGASSSDGADGADGSDSDGSDSDSGAAPEDRPVASAELLEHDMGLGLPFRAGTFDGAVSVSALQWLCYDNATAQRSPRRLARFFSSLHACLRGGARAALQFYPENDAQARAPRARIFRSILEPRRKTSTGRSGKRRRLHLEGTAQFGFRRAGAVHRAGGRARGLLRGRRRGLPQLHAGPQALPLPLHGAAAPRRRLYSTCVGLCSISRRDDARSGRGSRRGDGG
mmetsp:Transcript_4248/g.13286  ORF Transcript_4248/g.13286 Transcript_4248/m.13286 type:complete len:281 (+) Transcript_4248:412-1254(+)